MADPTRSRILERLLQGPGNPAQLARDLHLTPSNVSNHLTCLRGCGLVLVTPQGRRASYEIADPHLTQALAALVDVVLAVDDGAPCLDEDCTVPLCCPTPGARETSAPTRGSDAAATSPTHQVSGMRS